MPPALSPRPNFYPDWSGKRCVIVASGPSAGEADVDAAQGYAKVIAINNSWRLAPWADVLYAIAAGQYRGKRRPLRGLNRSAVDGVHHVEMKRGASGWHNRMVLDETGVIGAGGCSGFQALNLAVQFGARDIALVGYDARVDRGIHWHGRHGGGLNNPTQWTTASWARHLDAAAPVLADAGVRVVNCSAESALCGYSKISLREWLADAVV